MDGLEAVEITNKELTSLLRLDSNFFSKESQTLFSILEKNKLYSIGQVSNYITDMGAFSFYNSKYFCDKGIPFLRVNNIKQNMIELSDIIYISQEYHKELKKSQLRPRDVLLTTKAIIGMSATVPEDIGECNMSQNLVRIGFREELFNPYYVSTFFNTKYGYLQSNRLATGNVQHYLNFDNIKKIRIPLFTETFQSLIEKTVKKANFSSDKSKHFYFEAEEVLLIELGLKNWKSPEENIKVKSFRNSFVLSGRLDAEYYQLKYDEIEEKIKRYKGGYERISDCCTINDKNFMLLDNASYNYIELSNIGCVGEIKGYVTGKGNELPSRAKRIVNTRDIVVSSIEGSLDSCALITHEFDNFICSTGFYIINSRKINSETLLLIMKSSAIQALMKKACSGTILTSVNKNDFENIIIPIISEDVQELISQKIKKSFKQKRESEQLLELAKKAVEVAIEEGEEKAMAMIKSRNIG